MKASRCLCLIPYWINVVQYLFICLTLPISQATCTLILQTFCLISLALTLLVPYTVILKYCSKYLQHCSPDKLTSSILHNSPALPTTHTYTIYLYWVHHLNPSISACPSPWNMYGVPCIMQEYNIRSQIALCTICQWRL